MTLKPDIAALTPEQRLRTRSQAVFAPVPSPDL